MKIFYFNGIENETCTLLYLWVQELTVRTKLFFKDLTEVAKGAKYSKCPSIEIDENEKWKGPKCDTDYCHRRCKDGFTPGEPSKVLILLFYLSLTFKPQGILLQKRKWNFQMDRWNWCQRGSRTMSWTSWYSNDSCANNSSPNMQGYWTERKSNQVWNGSKLQK